MKKIRVTRAQYERIISIYMVASAALSASIIFLIGKVHNKALISIILMVSFIFCKSYFTNEYHSKRTTHCNLLSIAVFLALIRISPDISVSITAPVLLGIGAAYIASKRVEEKELLKKANDRVLELELELAEDFNSAKIEKKNSKWLKSLTILELEKLCNLAELNEQDKKLIIAHYEGKVSKVKLALMFGYSERGFYPRIRKLEDVLTKYRDKL